MSITVEKSPSLNAFPTLERAVYAKDPFHLPIRYQAPDNSTCFIARENQQPIALCCAQLQTGNPTIGTIGQFHSMDHFPGAQAILEVAIQHLRDQGCKRIIGPMDGDTWHPYRFNRGPYDAPPFIKEPWNPPYYPALWEAAGFTVIETYDSYMVDPPVAAAANQKKFYQRCLQNGYTFEPITAHNYAHILPLIHTLSCRIFSENKLYTPVDLEEFKRMYLPARALMRTGLSWLAYAPDKSPAGYIFTFPDYSAALSAMGGKTTLAAKIRFLMNKSKATRTCIKTLGTIPEKRGSGLTAALTYLSYKNSAELGYNQTLMCLMHSSNDSRRFGGKVDQPFRSYALYEFTK